MITERPTLPPNVCRQQRLDLSPLRIREHPEPRRRLHPTMLSRASPNLWETRPSGLLYARRHGTRDEPVSGEDATGLADQITRAEALRGK
jgi:hypothetical protein